MTGVAVTELGTVQETALLTLWSRAAESTRPAPILRDAKAVELVQAIDYDFSKFAAYTRGQLGCCCRAQILDGYVAGFLQRHPDGTVVDIGAGLDTRFERLDNGKVRWFDLDLADSMAIRRKFFQECSRRRFLVGSVFDEAWWSALGEVRGEECLFVAEGVLLYFPERHVRRLFGRLADHFPGAHFALDACSPLIRRTARFFEAVGTTRASFQWGIADLRRIERWDRRHRVLETAQITRQHLERWPRWVRLLNDVLPVTRNFYTAGLVQLSAPA
jgi:O-methyltransferase involved in polyketide biosynthesis